MTIVNTSKCSTATQLTKVRRKKIVLAVCSGKNLLKWAGRKQGQAHILCLKAFVPGTTAELSQNWCFKVCSLNTEKDGNFVTNCSTRKSSLPSTQAFNSSPGKWSSQINLPKYYRIGSLLCSFIPNTPSCPMHTEVTWYIFSRTLLYLPKRTLVLPRVAHGRRC